MIFYYFRKKRKINKIVIVKKLNNKQEPNKEYDGIANDAHLISIDFIYVS